jgi:hypothetical protein
MNVIETRAVADFLGATVIVEWDGEPLQVFLDETNNRYFIRVNVRESWTLDALLKEWLYVTGDYCLPSEVEQERIESCKEVIAKELKK